MRITSVLRASLVAAVAVVGLMGSFGASAITLDFENLAHGEVVTSPIGNVTITAENFNRSFDIAAGFDSNQTGTRDTDLEAGRGLWSGGNIADQDLGTFLILQENDTGCGSGICDLPDDEGRRPAGAFTFDFGVSVLDFGFDLIDAEDAVAENSVLTFFDLDAGTSSSVDLMDFVTNGSIWYDATIELGNNTANRFMALTAEGLGLEKIDRVVFELGGSGAVDNIVATAVPEPSAALLIALGLGGIARWGRSKQR